MQAEYTKIEYTADGAPRAPVVYVVILNYNGLDLNDTCIDSLLETDYGNYKILFVDNGSTDGSVERVRQRYPTVEVLENGANLLFAAGNNRGIERALQQGADYLFILNNDTTVDRRCLSLLVSFMEDIPNAGAVQPLLCLMDHPERIASAGCRISLSGRTWDDAFGKPCTSFGREPRQVTGVTGGAMLVRADMLRQIGLFDERYSMYFEDVDLSLRLKKAGFTLHIVPEARVKHAVSTTTNIGFTPMRIQLSETNSYRIILDHFPLFPALIGYPLSLAFSIGVALRAALRGRPADVKAAILGAMGGVGLLIPSLNRRLGSKTQRKSEFIRFIDWKAPIPPRCRINEK